MNIYLEALIATFFGICIATLTYVVALHFGWILPANLTALEIGGVALNYSCVLLTARQNIVSWPIGILAVVLLGAIFWQLGLYSSLVLHIGYFIPVQFWGWWKWYKGKGNKDLPVTTLNLKQWGSIIVAAPLVWFAWYTICSYFGAAFVGPDAVILVVSVIAQFMLSYKKLESWVFWILVNVTSIYVYSQAGAPLLAMQYGFFLIYAFFGLYQWYKSWKIANNIVKFGR